jgi:hypothetical protein
MSEWQETGSTGDTWKPEEGDTITGVYKRMKENVGTNNSRLYVLQEFDKDDVLQSETTGVWGSTVLDARMDEVPEGSLVKIEFVGMEKGKQQKPYKNFRVWYKEAPMTEIIDRANDLFPTEE